jgi:hypothetical protein
MRLTALLFDPPRRAPHLQKHSYHQNQTTSGLWKHDTHLISFSLVINNFGVKYAGKENVQHLLDTVWHYYKCSWDWKGEGYCGLTLKWDYKGKKGHVSMPVYVTKALTCFRHPPPVKSQDQSYLHAKPSYGAKMQHAMAEDTIPPPPQQGGEETYPRSKPTFPFPHTRSQRRLTSCIQHPSIPTGKPNGTNDGTM